MGWNTKSSCAEFRAPQHGLNAHIAEPFRGILNSSFPLPERFSPSLAPNPDVRALAEQLQDELRALGSEITLPEHTLSLALTRFLNVCQSRDGNTRAAAAGVGQ
jgi:hypothetical protein